MLHLLRTALVMHLWGALNADRIKDDTGSIQIVVVKTPSPYKNKGGQTEPLYPESFVPSADTRLSWSRADRAPRPSHACALVLYLLLWTSLSISLTKWKRGKKTNHSSTYCCCSLSCQHISQTSSPPSHVDTTKWLPFALWLLCFSLSDAVFVAFAALIRRPSPNNRAIVSGSQRSRANSFPFSLLY